MPSIIAPYCVLPNIKRIYMVPQDDQEVTYFKKRLMTVFEKIFKGNNFIPIGHEYKDNIPLLLKIVNHLVKGTPSDIQKIDTLFTEQITKKFIFDIANAIELDQWHDFISDAYSKRIRHCKKDGLVDCIKHHYTPTSNNKGRLMDTLEKESKYRLNIRRNDEIDVSNNDPVKSFSDAQYTIIDTMPSYLKKIVDTNLIELKTAAYYIDSAPCKGGTSPLLYNFNTFNLNTHSELFIVNCALAFYQSFFKSLENFVFTINGMGDDEVSNKAYISLESKNKKYTINIKYLHQEQVYEHSYTAEGGQKGHFTVPNIVKTLVCDKTPKNSPSYDEIVNLIDWLDKLPGLSQNTKKNFIVSFLTLNKGFGDFVQMFMCLYLFYIKITINANVCVFLYNIILATCDSHLTYIALICECPFIIGGCETSRKIYMDGKSRYLDKTFEIVWNTYNIIKMYKYDSVPTGTVELPVFKWIPVINCVCDGKGKGKAGNNTSLSSIFTFESNNKSYLKLELDTLHTKSKIILQKENENLIIELTIGDYQIKLLNGEVYTPYSVPYVFKIIFKEDDKLDLNKLWDEQISELTIDFNKNLYKYLTTNVDVIITSILYNNFLYNMFIGNKFALENIKFSLANAEEFDSILFIPFTLDDFIREKKKDSKYAYRPIERFISWSIASNRSYKTSGYWSSGDNIKLNNFYDYIIRTTECLKVLFSYYIAIDEYIYKLVNFSKREENARSLGFNFIDFPFVNLIDSEGILVPLPDVLIKIFGDYKKKIIEEMITICETYNKSINVLLFFYYLPDQVTELGKIMIALNSDEYRSHADTEHQLKACSVAIKCFNNIIESHQRIKSYQPYIVSSGGVMTALINSEEACTPEGEDAEDIDALDSNEPVNTEANIANIMQILEEARLLSPKNKELIRVEEYIATMTSIRQLQESEGRPKRGKRKNEYDDIGSNKKGKMNGGYTISQDNNEILSFNIEDETKLSFLVYMDEHYIQLSLAQKPPCILKIALNFSLSELIYSIKEQSIYDTEDEDPISIMINSMHKLLAFTEFILYKSHDFQPGTIDIITLTNIRIYIEQILNEYNTVSLTKSSEDTTIAENSLIKLKQLLSQIPYFFTTLITFISTRCGLTAENFESITLTLDNEYNMETRDCIIVVYINKIRSFELKSNQANASKILIFCLGYELIKYTNEKVTAGTFSIKEKFGGMRGGIYKNNKAKRTIHYKKIQDVKENITGYVLKNAISRTISMSKLSKQPEKSPKPLKQPEKLPKPLKQPEKSPKPLKKPEKSPKLLKQPEKSPKPLKKPEKSPKPLKQPEKLPKQSKQSEKPPKPLNQPEKLPKPSKQPEKLPKPSKQSEKLPKLSKQSEKLPKLSKQPEKLPKLSKQPEQPEKSKKIKDDNSKNISKYKLRIEQFKNKKFSAYFEKKLKTILNDNNIYNIGIMKMRNILKNIYKIE
jgi:hypothetical protein